MTRGSQNNRSNMASFDEVIEKIKEREGGYVNDAKDPGGETKFGISHNTHREVDIANLTWKKAKDIYRNKYWDECKVGQLPDKLRPMFMDTIVLHGTQKGTKMLQKALGVNADGRVGPNTIRVANSQNALTLVENMAQRRLAHYRKQPTYKRFGKGWEARVAIVKKECANVMQERVEEKKECANVKQQRAEVKKECTNVKKGGRPLSFEEILNREENEEAITDRLNREASGDVVRKRPRRE